MEINNYQSKIYSKLYKIGKNINETNTVEDLFETFSLFATEDLNFQKCLIFRHDDKNGWFSIVSSKGYVNEKEKQIVKIINLLLSGEIIEYLRINGEAIIHTQKNINKKVQKLAKSLFLEECYFELIGGTIDMPFGLIVVGNSKDEKKKYSEIKYNSMLMLALSSLSVQISNAINNIIFYNAWNDEKKDLEENIRIRTKEISEQKVLFETMYYGSKDAIGIIDMESNFLSVNPAYEELTGFTNEELLSTSCLSLTPQKDMMRSKKAIQEVENIGFIKNFVKECKVANDKDITIDMSMSMLYNPKRILISIRDITNDIIFKNKLIKANKQITFSNNIKQQFIANMSHEIRTPMNGIIGMSYLAKKTSTDDNQKEYLSKIISSTKTLLEIVNDILDFSKLEEKKYIIENISFNIHEVIQSVVDVLDFKIKEKNLTLEVNYSENINSILYGDPLKIKQILINIIGNAIKFTQKGGINININEISKNKFKFEVIDTGIGLDKNSLNLIFEPFSQVDNINSQRFEGTGLGLSIVKKLIDLMNGEMTIKSKKNKGTTFTFILDLYEEKIENNANKILNTNSYTDLIYINTKIGLENFHGNKKNYLSALNSFLSKYKNIDIKGITKDEIIFYVNIISEISSNIGAIKLFDACEVLKNNYSNTNKNKFNLQLSNIINELDKKLNQIKSNVAIEYIDNLFLSLRESALINIPKNCNIILDEINTYNLSNTHKKLYDESCQYLKKYDFKSICKLIEDFNE